MSEKAGLMLICTIIVLVLIAGPVFAQDDQQQKTADDDPFAEASMDEISRKPD